MLRTLDQQIDLLDRLDAAAIARGPVFTGVPVISSRGGRRGGLISTAAMVPASNRLGTIPAMPDRPSDSVLPDAAYICITCHHGPRPGHPLTRIDTGGYVHRHKCPSKRIPPPPRR